MVKKPSKIPNLTLVKGDTPLILQWPVLIQNETDYYMQIINYYILSYLTNTEAHKPCITLW